MKSLDAHWSAGGRASVSRSTYSNYKLQARAMPAVEYNVFPFSESTRRQIRIYYGAGVEHSVYADTTIFEKTREVQAIHNGGVATEFAQPWGSVDIYTEATHYLTLPDKYNLQIGGGVELRVIRGLSVRVDGQYSFVRDQINLPAEDPSDSEILTRQQELATGFNYYASVGLSYSFGSIYNQVVNARFGS